MRQFVELAKADVVFMYKTFFEVKKKYNKNITYVISFAKKVIENEAMSLIESMAPSDSYEAYETAKNKIISECAVVDGDGNLMVRGTAIKIQPEKAVECKARLAQLDLDNADILATRKADIASFEAKMDEHVSFQFELVEWNDIPEEIEQSLMDALLPIINKED